MFVFLFVFIFSLFVFIFNLFVCLFLYLVCLFLYLVCLFVCSFVCLLACLFVCFFYTCRPPGGTPSQTPPHAHWSSGCGTCAQNWVEYFFRLLPGCVLVLIDDLSLAEETLEGGGNDHHPAESDLRLVYFFFNYNILSGHTFTFILGCLDFDG